MQEKIVDLGQGREISLPTAPVAQVRDSHLDKVAFGRWPVIGITRGHAHFVVAYIVPATPRGNDLVAEYLGIEVPEPEPDPASEEG